MLKPPEPDVKTGATGATGAMDYNIDLNNIDSLLEEFAQPVQDFTPKPKEPGADEIYDPVSEGFPGFSSEPVEITPEENARNGERTARFFDGIISMAAQTIAKADTREPYKATDNDLEDLGKAWAEYTKDKNFNIPPWATLAMLYMTIYLPKITKAINDRRINELSDRITRLEEKEVKK